MAKIDPNAWMTTFADLLNLLLTFFVMLIAMSSMDNKKLKKVAGFFNGAVGVLEKSSKGYISSGPVTESSTTGNRASASSNDLVSGALKGGVDQTNAPDERGKSPVKSLKNFGIAGNQTQLATGQEEGWKEFSRNVLKAIHDDQMRYYLKVRSHLDGYEITLKNIDVFYKGEDKINPESTNLLKRMAYLGRICNCRVHIKGGYLKNENINYNKYPSFYHLSAKRAVRTTVLFQKEGVAGFNLYPEAEISGKFQISFYFETKYRTVR